ncbi:25S rRNA (adenine(2142)-N(1))-methyltransferase [Penicillium frequentans]|nr:25S rRNA (adenine(2142)-N(1))-methyltransferase [Penicillium glabrum]
MPPKRRSQRPGLLSSTRPPTVKSKHAALSAKATRTLIRSHHQLMKARAQAEAAGDEVRVSSINAQIEAAGGLESYQIASKLGQSGDRGGDSSKILVDWIKPQLNQWKPTFPQTAGPRSWGVKHEECLFQDPGLGGDPHRPEFSGTGLSLVLNYVPDPVGRGDMLKRCVQFLTAECPISLPPTLFFVLPVACVDNSRYLTENRLLAILESLGFQLAQSRRTSKLIYQLWNHTGAFSPQSFKKEMVNPGHKRNNFAVVMRES